MDAPDVGAGAGPSAAEAVASRDDAATATTARILSLRVAAICSVRVFLVERRSRLVDTAGGFASEARSCRGCVRSLSCSWLDGEEEITLGCYIRQGRARL